MKYVIGIIRGGTLEKLSRELGRGGIYRLTISEVEILDTAAASSPGEEERRLRVEIAVNDDFLAPALQAFEAVRDADETAPVSVLPLEEVVRIRTGETGREAI